MVPPEERKGSEWVFKDPVVLWLYFKTLNWERSGSIIVSAGTLCCHQQLGKLLWVTYSVWSILKWIIKPGSEPPRP